MIKFLKKFIFSFNIIAIIALLLSYASVYVHPNELWFLALFGLSFLLIVIINVVFVVFWAIQFNWRAIVGVIALLIGAPFYSQNIKLIQSKNENENCIEVMTYNAGLFGYFESKWYVQETIDKINELKTDFICIQEFLNIKTKTGSTIDSFIDATAFKYHHFEKLKDGRKVGEYGMLILSNFPIQQSGLVQFDQYTGNMCVFSDLRFENKVFRVFNVHLQSFRFRKKDYQFISKITEQNQEKVEASKSLLKKIKTAYVMRANQVDTLMSFVNQTELPYFILGDFNDPPMSYSYQTLSSNLNDAFVENGIGIGKTYIGIMPNFRIDYILYPKFFEGIEYKTYTLSSDHKLLKTKILLKDY